MDGWAAGRSKEPKEQPGDATQREAFMLNLVMAGSLSERNPLADRRPIQAQLSHTAGPTPSAHLGQMGLAVHVPSVERVCALRAAQGAGSKVAVRP